ncbi:MAG: GxxExxY protein [Bacteroidales bacterium]
MKYYSFFFVFKGAHEIASLSSEKEYPLQKKTIKPAGRQVIGICMEVHRILGKGLLEIVYKDVIEYEFNVKKFH